jgi:hypothetical protein
MGNGDLVFTWRELCFRRFEYFPFRVSYFDVGHQCPALAVLIFGELLDGRWQPVIALAKNDWPDGGSELVEISTLLASAPVYPPCRRRFGTPFENW